MNSLSEGWTGPTGTALQCLNNGDVMCDAAAHLLIVDGILNVSTTAGSLTFTTAVSGTTGSPAPGVAITAGSYLRLTRVI